MQVIFRAKLESPNIKIIWQKKYLKDRHMRRDLRFLLMQHNRPDLPCRITLKRCGKRKMDSDNVVTAFKHIRDEVADYLIPNLRPGQADGDPRIEWVYSQEISRDYSIVVIIDPLGNSS